MIEPLRALGEALLLSNGIINDDSPFTDCTGPIRKIQRARNDRQRYQNPLPVSPAGIALGFAVTAGPSFMQVGRYRGRYYLRDGYHRAFGLLSRGITTVPTFTREISVFEELVPNPRTMLPQDGYLGDRPPVLADYLDDQVSAAVQLPSARKMVLVQAMELTLAG